jgi:tetratricopeptide (TPR) repeat protein
VAPVVVARHEPARARASIPAASRPAMAPSRSGGDPLANLEATDAILARGQRAFDRADYTEAVRRGREAVSAGAVAAGHLLAGDAYYRLERYDDAVREYDAVLLVEPTNSSAKRRRSLAQQRAR